jgi:hypothetical protein
MGGWRGENCSNTIQSKIEKTTGLPRNSTSRQRPLNEAVGHWCQGCREGSPAGKGAVGSTLKDPTETFPEHCSWTRRSPSLHGDVNKKRGEVWKEGFQKESWRLKGEARRREVCLV